MFHLFLLYLHLIVVVVPHTLYTIICWINFPHFLSLPISLSVIILIIEFSLILNFLQTFPIDARQFPQTIIFFLLSNFLYIFFIVLFYKVLSLFFHKSVITWRVGYFIHFLWYYFLLYFPNYLFFALLTVIQVYLTCVTAYLSFFVQAVHVQTVVKLRLMVGFGLMIGLMLMVGFGFGLNGYGILREYIIFL